MPPTPRLTTEELLDAPHQEPAELAASLDQVAQVDRLFGGSRALRRHLRPFLSHSELKVLDVGTGNGRVAAELARWSAGQGVRWSVTGLDNHPDVVEVARRGPLGASPELTLVRGDALALPFPDRSFDVVCCTLTLHHFDDEAAVRLVGEMARVARRSVLVNDLERNSLNYLSARALSLTLWRSNRLTRNDGPLSVLRSFTVPELLAIGTRSGLQAPRVTRHFPFRLVLEGAPGTVAGGWA